MKIKGTNKPDRLFGSNGDDVISGKKGSDILYGGDGNDVLKGGRGKDILYGGDGDNILRGGKGNDVFFVPAEGFANIMDFKPGKDRVIISGFENPHTPSEPYNGASYDGQALSYEGHVVAQVDGLTEFGSVLFY